MSYNQNFLLLMSVMFIDIVLYFITLSWIVILEKDKCECSQDWRRQFIKYFIIGFYIHIVLTYIYLNINPDKGSILFNFIIIQQFIFYTLQIIYIFVVFSYIRDLIKKRCKCSEMIHRDISYVYSLADIILFVIGVIWYVLYFLMKKGRRSF